MIRIALCRLHPAGNSTCQKGTSFLEQGYFVRGVNDKTHEITGTTISYQKDIRHEPFQHYLARQIQPDRVPKIVDVYGRQAFDFRENSIVVTIPFKYLSHGVVDKPVDKLVDKPANETRSDLKGSKAEREGRNRADQPGTFKGRHNSVM